MKYSSFAVSVLTLLGLNLHKTADAAVPPTTVRKSFCSTPVQIAGIDAFNPAIWSQASSTNVFYESNPAYGGGNRNINYVNFGLDDIPGTPDDVTGILSNGLGAFDSSPKTDGRYVVFKRSTNQGTSLDVMLYDLGVDGLPGTSDDVPEFSIATYNNSFTNYAQLRSNVSDGLVIWAVNRDITVGSTARTQIAMCDARLPIGLPGSCSQAMGTLTEVNLPQSTQVTSRNLMARRDFSLGFELQLAYLKLTTQISPFNFSQSSIIFEPNLGAVLGWPANSSVEVLGFVQGTSPLVSEFVGNTQQFYLASPLNPTPTLAITAPFQSSSPWPTSLSIMGVNGVFGGAQGLLWTALEGGFFQQIFNPAVKVLNQINYGQATDRVRLENPALDDRFVVYEHLELPATSPFPANRFGLFVTDCS